MTKREKLLRALKGCGATSDKATFTRLYVENRISLAVANAAWREGAKFAKFIEDRDKANMEAIKASA